MQKTHCQPQVKNSANKAELCILFCFGVRGTCVLSSSPVTRFFLALFKHAFRFIIQNENLLTYAPCCKRCLRETEYNHEIAVFFAVRYYVVPECTDWNWIFKLHFARTVRTLGTCYKTVCPDVLFFSDVPEFPFYKHLKIILFLLLYTIK